MNDRQRRRNKRGQRVDVYMDANAEDFLADGKAGTLTAHLKELLTRAAALDVAREANERKRQQGTEGRDEARTTLRRMVKSVWDTHKTIARDHPDIRGLFEPPSKSNNDQALVSAARASADAAAPLAGLFAEYGLTAAFFNDVRAKADSLESYITLQNVGGGAGVDTNAALEETLRQMDEAVERLNTLVTNKYLNDPVKYAAWESARRLERPARPKPHEDEDEAPAPPPRQRLTHARATHGAPQHVRKAPRAG